MAALVAVALAQATDRTPLLAAILADRYGRLPVLLGAVAALALGHGVAAAGGALVAPMLTPNARQLLLALALIFAGVSAPFPGRSPDRLAGWRLGALATSFLGLVIMAFGDSAQFITAAAAARSPVPPLAAVGATLGSLAVVVPAAMLGEAGWQRLPLRRLRLAIAGLLLVTGTILALGALSLV